MPVFTSSIELSDDYPTVVPSLKLNFARSRALDPRIAFTRGSVGTYVGRDGLVKTARVNEPRFDHDSVTLESLGLLIEESRTNLIAYSVINTANWNTNTSTNTNNTTETKAPDGSDTAFKYVPNNGGTGWVSVYNTANVISMTSGTTYTYSVWAKPSHSDFTGFRINGDIRDGGGIDISANFVLSGDGSVSGTYESASITKYPNGWYRCVATATADATTNEEPAFQTSSPGDGTKGFYVWGYQVEVGAFATSYIPTSGSTVTRAADNAEIMYDGWYDNGSSVKPSTFVGKFQTYNLDATRMVAEGSNGSTLKDFSMNTLAGSGNLQFAHRYTADNSYGSTIGSNIALNTPVTFAFSYDGTGGDITGSANSSTPNVGNDDLGTTSQIGGDRMRIGSRGNSSLYLNGTISELRYYKFKATSDQLLLLQ